MDLPVFRLQNSRLLTIEFPHKDGPDAELMVDELVAIEGISRDFEYTVELLSLDANIPLKALMGRKVTIALANVPGRPPRYFNGYVTRFEHTGTDGGMAKYRIVLSPWTAQMHRRYDQRIFQNKGLPATFDEMAKGCDPPAEYEYRFSKSYGDETYRVMFAESEHNYFNRRFEEKGWVYWFEHTKDSHKMIVTDDTTLAKPIDGLAKIEYQGGANVVHNDDYMDGWHAQRDLASGRYSVRSYDFKQPRNPLAASIDTINRQGEVTPYEVYEYPGAYAYQNSNDGEALAKLRIEAIEANARLYTGEGNARGLTVGRTFALTSHYEHDRKNPEDSEFFVVQVIHRCGNNYQTGGSGENPAYYRNAVVALRKKIPYRVPRGHNSHPVRMPGPQTARVVGPPNETIWCDEYGRVLIEFPWDRRGLGDHRASCWVRVNNPIGGGEMGGMFLPRVGQEVAVDFLNGDPDQPVIMGRFYNADNMPPWPLPASRNQMGLYSRSIGGGYENSNAFRFDDTPGKEEVWLRAERDQRIEVEHDETHWVGQDRRKTIDRDETNYIKRDRTEVVDRDETITVHNHRTERVDHDERISIGDHRTEDVGKDEKISVGLNRTRTVGKSEKVKIGHNKTIRIGRFKTETIGMASMQNVGLGKMTNIGLGYLRNVGAALISIVLMWRSDKVGKTWSREAGDKIEDKVGTSQVTLTPNAIYLIADTIHIIGRKNVHIDAPNDIHLNTGTAQPAPGFSGKGTAFGGLAGAISGVTAMVGDQGGELKPDAMAGYAGPAAQAPDGGGLTRSSIYGGSDKSGVGRRVTTGLGAEVDAIAAHSPSLQQDLAQVKRDKWQIEYGPEGGGTLVKRGTEPPRIIIDGKKQGNPAEVVSSLAHEVGHAKYPFKPDYSSKAAYVNGALGDEAMG